MSSLTTQFPPDPSPEPAFRLSVEQYHAMIDAGVLTDDDKVELLEGMLVQQMPKKPQHRFVLRQLFKAIDAMLPKGFFVQLQEPITLSTSEPEPDASVVRGDDKDYVARHPGPGDVPLVIEVSDTTLRRDRGIKQRSYARAGLAVYWIVNLEARCIEVHRNPHKKASPPVYDEPELFDENSVVPVEVFGRTIGQLRVADVLP